jgi:mannosyl-3-phosphoglycerate phosphatase
VAVSEKALGVELLGRMLEEVARLSGLPLQAATRMTAAELQRITGLPDRRVPAMLARRFGLPFLAPEGAGPALEAAVRGLPGVRLTRGGFFWHLSGNHGKEDALDLLLRKGLASRPLAGFGDAPNDAAFLALCDVAILVPGPSGEVDAALAAAVPAGRIAPFPGGRGWAAAVNELLTDGT